MSTTLLTSTTSTTIGAAEVGPVAINIGELIRSHPFRPGLTREDRDGKLCEVEYLSGRYPIVATFVLGKMNAAIIKDSFVLVPIQIGRAPVGDRLLQRLRAPFERCDAEIREVSRIVCEQYALNQQSPIGRIHLRGGLAIKMPAFKPTSLELHPLSDATLKEHHLRANFPVLLRESAGGQWSIEQAGHVGGVQRLCVARSDESLRLGATAESPGQLQL